MWNIKSWKRRKRGTRQEEDEMFETAVIGRMYAVSPSQGESFFFLSLLLHHVQGPRSYKDLKTANDTLCLTYRDVCIRRKLLENDNVHLLTPEEASVGVSPKPFAVMLTHCGPSNPIELWSRQCTNMSEGCIF